MAGPTQNRLNEIVRLLLGQSAPQPQQVNPFNVPFTGLRNQADNLPPFQMPGEEFNRFRPLLMRQQMEQEPLAPTQLPTMPATTIAASPMPAEVPQASPAVEAPQAAGQPDVRKDVVAALVDMQRRNLLPEQWKGAFSNQYGEPQ